MRHDFIGEHIGPYYILAAIVSGEYTTIYQARDTRQGQSVVLKVFDRASTETSHSAKRFDREIKIVVSLDHENILPVLFDGEEESHRYFVMDYMKNGTLRQFLDRRRELERPLPVNMVLALGIQLCNALQYAHQHGIIHRDVKPANIFLDNEDPFHLRLGDFGIAVLLEELERLTGTGKTVGTPEYMSPEQAQGREIDGRTDDYATASVLYEMLSLRPPFTGSSAVSICISKLHDPPIPVNRHNPDVPQNVVAVLHQALNRFPNERFYSSEVFATALGSCLQQVDEHVRIEHQKGVNVWSLPTLVLSSLVLPADPTPVLTPTIPVKSVPPATAVEW